MTILLWIIGVSVVLLILWLLLKPSRSRRGDYRSGPDSVESFDIDIGDGGVFGD